MIRGVRGDQRRGKQAKEPLKRSKSKSRSRSPAGNKGKKQPATSRDKKNNRNRSPSIARSVSKKDIKKSQSSKKIKRNASQPKVGNKSKLSSSPSALNRSPAKSPIKSPLKRAGGKQDPPRGVRKAEPSNGQRKVQAPVDGTRKLEVPMKQEQKDMGLVAHLPEHEKILLKQIDTLDAVYEKFLEMVSNDNDASYVLNALPEFRDIRKEDDTGGRDFISGKITRLSGIFQDLSVERIAGPLRKVPIYYSGQCGKNLVAMKISLQTKFKILVDVGFLQYSLDGDKITIFRIYVSKIYRKMNYTAFAYLESLKGLMEKHPAADRWSIFILERNLNVHKFFKFLGLKIEKIITDSKVKSQVEYYQEFTIKKKELQTAIASFK